MDDDIDTCEALSAYLTQYNYHTVVAHSVKEATQKLRRQEFFCVITDIRLGTESGEEVIDFTKQKSTVIMSPNVPVIVISGFLDKDLVQNIIKKVHGALVKPFDLQVVIQKLKDIKSPAA